MTCSFVVLATTQDLQSPLAPRTMCQGYVVNNEGDTAQGWIKFMTVIANQFNVSLYENESDDTPVGKYKPKDLNEVMGREEVLSVDLDEGITVQYFGVRGNGKPVDFSSVKYGMNFKKHMSKYVSDCPELADKISAREEGYGYENLAHIIVEYNRWLQ